MKVQAVQCIHVQIVTGENGLLQKSNAKAINMLAAFCTFIIDWISIPQIERIHFDCIPPASLLWSFVVVCPIYLCLC